MSILTQTHIYTCTHSTLMSTCQPRADSPPPRLSVRNPEVEYVPVLCLHCRKHFIPLTFEAAGQLPHAAIPANTTGGKYESTQVARSGGLLEDTADEGARRRRAENRSARVIDGFLLCTQGSGPVMYAPQRALTTSPAAAAAEEVHVSRTEAASSPLHNTSVSVERATAHPKPLNTAQLERDHGELRGAYTVNPDPPSPPLAPPPKTPMTRARPLPKSKYAAKKEAIRERFAALKKWVRGLLQERDSLASAVLVPRDGGVE